MVFPGSPRAASFAKATTARDRLAAAKANLAEINPPSLAANWRGKAAVGNRSKEGADDDRPQVQENVFQLWKEGGEKLPFKVSRWTWNTEKSAFLVERIEIGKWPYGKAWGRFTRNGAPEAPQQLDGAGSYQWKVVE